MEGLRFSQHKSVVRLVELEMEADSVAKPEGLGILDGRVVGEAGDAFDQQKGDVQGTGEELAFRLGGSHCLHPVVNPFGDDVVAFLQGRGKRVVHHSFFDEVGEKITWKPGLADCYGPLFQIEDSLQENGVILVLGKP